MAFVFIGLGSNIGDCEANLKRALDELQREGLLLVKQSGIEVTEPVDFPDQPDFNNQVILVKTDKDPLSLLHLLKSIEKKMGRKVSVPKGPRVIDLDILLYDKFIINLDELNIPHPGIKKRWFVLKHLVELYPDLADPLTGELYSDIYNKSFL